MDLGYINNRIIERCLERYGAGEVFYRSDGLAFEERRAALRAAYLQEHSETTPEYRELIEKGGVTPGMSRFEHIAAWGLVEEDLKDVRGWTASDENHRYAYCYGFNVVRHYWVFLREDTIVGVKEDTGECVA